MDGPQFDRQAFVKPHEPPPKPAPSRLGLLFLFVAIGAAGFVAYKYMQSTRAGEIGKGDPDVAQIAQRLEKIEKRLEQLEKRRKAAPEEPSTPSAKTAPVIASSSPSLPARQTASRVPPATNPGPDPSLPGGPGRDRQLPALQQQVSSLRSDVNATREAWEATTDQLGRTVGELGSQRSEIARNRENLNQLLKRLDRTALRFDLQKRMGRQRIGPVWVWLRRTDPKNQRYTLRLFVDEKWVEMKDKSLAERVEFYMSGFTVPLELVVSEIRVDQISGYLGLPKEAAKR